MSCKAVEAQLIEELLAIGQQIQKQMQKQVLKVASGSAMYGFLHWDKSNGGSWYKSHESGYRACRRGRVDSPRRCTWLADTRFSPWPPAFRLTRNTTGLPAPAHEQRHVQDFGARRLKLLLQACMPSLQYVHRSHERHSVRLHHSL